MNDRITLRSVVDTVNSEDSLKRNLSGIEHGSCREGKKTTLEVESPHQGGRTFRPLSVLEERILIPTEPDDLLPRVQSPQNIVPSSLHRININCHFLTNHTQIHGLVDCRWDSGWFDHPLGEHRSRFSGLRTPQQRFHSNYIGSPLLNKTSWEVNNGLGIFSTIDAGESFGCRLEEKLIRRSALDRALPADQEYDNGQQFYPMLADRQRYCNLARKSSNSINWWFLETSTETNKNCYRSFFRSRAPVCSFFCSLSSKVSPDAIPFSSNWIWVVSPDCCPRSYLHNKRRSENSELPRFY